MSCATILVLVFLLVILPLESLQSSPPSPPRPLSPFHLRNLHRLRARILRHTYTHTMSGPALVITTPSGHRSLRDAFWYMRIFNISRSLSPPHALKWLVKDFDPNDRPRMRIPKNCASFARDLDLQVSSASRELEAWELREVRRRKARRKADESSKHKGVEFDLYTHAPSSADAKRYLAEAVEEYPKLRDRPFLAARVKGTSCFSDFLRYGRVSRAQLKDLRFATKYIREGMVREGWGDAKFRFDPTVVRR